MKSRYPTNFEQTTKLNPTNSVYGGNNYYILRVYIFIHMYILKSCANLLNALRECFLACCVHLKQIQSFIMRTKTICMHVYHESGTLSVDTRVNKLFTKLTNKSKQKPEFREFPTIEFTVCRVSIRGLTNQPYCWSTETGVPQRGFA